MRLYQPLVEDLNEDFICCVCKSKFQNCLKIVFYRNREQPITVCKHQLFNLNLPLLCGCPWKVFRCPLLQILPLALHGSDQSFRAAFEIIAQSASWISDYLSKLQTSISFARSLSPWDLALSEQTLCQRTLWLDPRNVATWPIS